MSMRDYPTEDYGFLFPQKALLAIARKAIMEHNADISLDNDEEADLLDEDYLNNDIYLGLCELRGVMKKVFGLEVSLYSCFTGYAETISEIQNLKRDSYSASFDDDNFLLLPLHKEPKLIGVAYTTVEAVIEEVKSELSVFSKEFQDADIDIPIYIVAIHGVVLG